MLPQEHAGCSMWGDTCMLLAYQQGMSRIFAAFSAYWADGSLYRQQGLKESVHESEGDPLPVIDFAK